MCSPKKEKKKVEIGNPRPRGQKVRHAQVHSCHQLLPSKAPPPRQVNHRDTESRTDRSVHRTHVPPRVSLRADAGRQTRGRVIRQHLSSNRGDDDNCAVGSRVGVLGETSQDPLPTSSGFGGVPEHRIPAPLGGGGGASSDKPLSFAARQPQRTHGIRKAAFTHGAPGPLP